MNSQRYFEFIRATQSPRYDLRLAVVALAEEVGELAGVVKKSAIYDDVSKFEEKYGMSSYEKIIDEAGDILYQLGVVLNLAGIDFDVLMQKNYDKLIVRHGGKGISKDGGKR